MSFSSDTKKEICRAKVDRKCCAIAECYGILLYCNSFTQDGIRIITAQNDFAARLPVLFRKAFGVSFDVMPDLSALAETGDEKADARKKKSFIINNENSLKTILKTFGQEDTIALAHHVNYSVIEEDCCRVSFIRGAFLAGGSVTDPEKRYHLELATNYTNVIRETYSVLLDMGFSPRESTRDLSGLIYFKQADAIADFLTTIGASKASMDVMTAKVEKEVRNRVTRLINCDSANVDKTVAAAQAQIAAIHRYSAKNGLNTLPEKLRDAAILRVTNPEVSLADLAKLSSPPVSKSCLSHRLNKIVEMAGEEEE